MAELRMAGSDEVVRMETGPRTGRGMTEPHG